MKQLGRLAIVAAAAAMLGCGRPPLRVTARENKVVIDLQTLGEYPSNVARLRLTDVATQKVVWELVGIGEPQIGRLELIVGENAAAASDVRHGRYDVVAPKGQTTFNLQPRRKYLIEAWGRDATAHTRSEAHFSTPG